MTALRDRGRKAEGDDKVLPREMLGARYLPYKADAADRQPVAAMGVATGAPIPHRLPARHTAHLHQAQRGAGQAWGGAGLPMAWV